MDEIRFDWSVAGTATSFALPGLEAELPAAARYSLILRKEDDTLNHFALCVTLAKDATAAVLSSFAWMRDGERELHNDEGSGQKPLFKLSATAKKEISLMLIDLKLGAQQFPTFLQQLEDATPIAALDLSKPDSLKVLVPLKSKSLSDDGWTLPSASQRGWKSAWPV